VNDLGRGEQLRGLTSSNDTAIEVRMISVRTKRHEESQTHFTPSLAKTIIDENSSRFPTYVTIAFPDETREL